MMRLLFAPASPYSAKVRMAAAVAGLPLEAVPTDTNAAPAELLQANPLGKIPVLVIEGEDAVFDSRVILKYLDRLSSGRVFPAEADALLRAEKLEALADGICDCLLAHVYERRARPPEKIHQPWLDRQWSKAARALDLLEGEAAGLGTAPNGGTLALRAALGYLALRFAGEWAAGWQSLHAWAKNFDGANPALVPLLPA